jgi:hypothetical protein
MPHKGRNSHLCAKSVLCLGAVAASHHKWLGCFQQLVPWQCGFPVNECVRDFEKQKRIIHGIQNEHEEGGMDKNKVRHFCLQHTAVPCTYTLIKRGRSKINVNIIVDYNNTVRGEDHIHQDMADYPILRKCGKKYYNFFHQLEQARVWLFFPLQKYCGRKVHLECHLALVEQIIGAHHRNVVSPGAGRHFSD